MDLRDLTESEKQQISRLYSRGVDISAQSHLYRTTIHVTETELTDAEAASPSSRSSDDNDSYSGQKYLRWTKAPAIDRPPQSSNTSIEAGKITQYDWKPSIFRISPLLGLAALIFGLVQIIAAYAVLVAAEGTRIEEWKVSPSVCLAVLTAISNKALSFSVIQGTVVTWWRKAIRNEGTTLAQMHRDWGYGNHTLKALLAGRNFNILALGCLCATFVAIDGPLLQRASSVGLAVPQQPVSLNVSISPEVPAYFTGWSSFVSSTWYYIDYQTDFLPVSRAYSKSAPIDGKGAITGCSGICSATVNAPALVIENCTSSLQFQNFYANLTDEESRAVQLTSSPPESRLIFKTAFWTVNGTTERLVMKTAFSDEQVAKTCRGHVNTTTCWLSPVIAEYSIVVTNDIISFDGGQAPSYPPVVAPANNTALTDKSVAQFNLLDKSDPGDWIKTTLSGVAQAAFTKWYASYGIVPSLDAGLLVLPEFNSAGDNTIANYHAWDYGIDCAPAWKDPYDEILGSLNEIMFRTGVYVAQSLDENELKSRIDPGLEISYNVQGTPLSEVNVFTSNFAYFAAAAVVELFTIAIIAFTFFGWWRLGRNVSFSPIEIAKAFDAPLLRNPLLERGQHSINHEDGHSKVQYGILRDQRNGGDALAIANAQHVYKVSEERVSAKECFNLLLAKLRCFTQGGHLQRVRFGAKGDSV